MTMIHANGGISDQRGVKNGVESTGEVVHESLQLFFKFFKYALYTSLCMIYGQ